MKILMRLKIILFIPFAMLFFPMMIILGEDKTNAIGDWIQDID